MGTNDIWLACYGTLRRRSLYGRVNHAAAGQMQFWGYGLVYGKLHWHGSYPALVNEPGLVRVEIYRVNAPAVFVRLDAYEGYVPDRPVHSLFLRRLTALHRPRLRAWVYHLNGTLKGFVTPGGFPADGQPRGSAP